MTQEQVTQKANGSVYKGDVKKVYQDMASKYNECTGENITANDAKTQLVIGQNADSNKYYVYACQCYEYMQFKRSVFKCTDLTYDDATGRVEGIVFYFIKVR